MKRYIYLSNSLCGSITSRCPSPFNVVYLAYNSSVDPSRSGLNRSDNVTYSGKLHLLFGEIVKIFFSLYCWVYNFVERRKRMDWWAHDDLSEVYSMLHKLLCVMSRLTKKKNCPISTLDLVGWEAGAIRNKILAEKQHAYFFRFCVMFMLKRLLYINTPDVFSPMGKNFSNNTL